MATFLESESEDSYVSEGDSDSESSPINLSNLPSQSAPKKWDAFRVRILRYTENTQCHLALQ